jgi:Lanthionine synthetase C-like protein
LAEAAHQLPAAGTNGSPNRTVPRTQCLEVGEPTTDELLCDGLAHLIGTMTPDGQRLWPSGDFGAGTDPRNVQHGAAGVLELLVRALVDGDPQAPRSGDLEATTRKAACWLATRAERGGEPLPGMYFGRSGVAWALADAAGALAEPHLLELAGRLALRLPVEWPNPDVAHGLAGAALTHVRLGQLTADGRLAERLRGYADGLRLAAVPGPDGPLWPIPTSFDSQLAGTCHYGFAHGVAGVGYALLAAGRALDEPAYVDLACDAGYLLCRVAQTDDNGAAWWPVGPNELTRLPHWCSGASGVGTFLLRLLAVTGEQRFSEYARAAAGEVYQSRWRSSSAACHGLAGDGQFLLDLADQLDDPTYRAWAEDLVRLMAVRHCRRFGRTLVPDETNRDVVADYNVGLAGVLAFLLRLRYGGVRPFTVDDVIVEGWPEQPRSAGWDRSW